MASKNFQIRLPAEEIEEIEKRAAETKISASAMARVFIRDGLSRFDRKHEHLIEKLDGLQRAVEQSNLLTAMSTAAVSFLDVPRVDGKTESGQERVKGNIQASMKMGRAIKKMGDDGLLGKES